MPMHPTAAHLAQAVLAHSPLPEPLAAIVGDYAFSSPPAPAELKLIKPYNCSPNPPKDLPRFHRAIQHLMTLPPPDPQLRELDPGRCERPDIAVEIRNGAPNSSSYMRGQLVWASQDEVVVSFQMSDPKMQALFDERDSSGAPITQGAREYTYRIDDPRFEFSVVRPDGSSCCSSSYAIANMPKDGDMPKVPKDGDAPKHDGCCAVM